MPKTPDHPNIIAFTGSHGTGKTTSVYDYAAKAKKTHAGNVGILMEVARICDQPVLNRDGQLPTEDAQRWIFSRQWNDEETLSHRYDWLISDRTIVDCIAYTVFGGHVTLADALMDMARHLMHRYHMIIFKPICANDYCTQDGFRSTNRKIRQRIEDILINLYDELGTQLIMDSYNPKPMTPTWAKPCVCHP